MVVLELVVGEDFLLYPDTLIRQHKSLLNTFPFNQVSQLVILYPDTLIRQHKSILNTFPFNQVSQLVNNFKENCGQAE